MVCGLEYTYNNNNIIFVTNLAIHVHHYNTIYCTAVGCAWEIILLCIIYFLFVRSSAVHSWVSESRSITDNVVYINPKVHHALDA